MLNLGTTHGGSSFTCALEAHKMWSCATPKIHGKEKIFYQNQLGDECVKDLVHQDE
jgi:hypothetical protein